MAERRWTLTLLAGALLALPLAAQADEAPPAVDHTEVSGTASEDADGAPERRPPWADDGWDGEPPPWANEDGPPDWVPGPPPWQRGEARGQGRADRPDRGHGPPWAEEGERRGPPPWAGTGDGPPWAEDGEPGGPPPWAGHGRDSAPGQLQDR